MSGGFQAPHPLPSRPWEAPQNLLCCVEAHLVYCDPSNHLSYVNPSDELPIRLHCGPPGSAADASVVPDASCQALPFAVREIVPHAVGHCLLAIGDRDVALVELPTPATVKAKRGNRCTVRLVGAPLFSQDSLMRVVGARWHPLSDRHVMLLTSDRQLRLFNTVRNAEESEQMFGLWTNSATDQPVGNGLSFQRYEADDNPENRVIGFSFLAGEGWNPFMVLYATAIGDVYCMGPILPFGCVVQGDLFDKLPLPTTAGGHPLPLGILDELHARRDKWRRAVLKSDPALQEVTPNIRIFVTRKTSSDFAEQYITTLGPINVEDEDTAHCASIEVLAVSPPVVALGLSTPAVKLFALTRPIFPAWLLEPLGDGSLQNVEVLQLFEMVKLHTTAAPTASHSPLARTSLHLDPLRPDRVFGSHPAEGVFALQLPAFFLPASDDRQLALRGTTVLSLVVAAAGGWPATLGLAVVHWDPDTPLQTGSQLYCLALQSKNGRDFSVVLRAIDLTTRPLLSATHSLSEAEHPDAVQPPPKPSAERPPCVMKAEELRKALQQLDEEKFLPRISQPLQPSMDEEEEWVELFRRMVNDLQHDRMERIQQLLQQMDSVEQDTEQVEKASSAMLNKLQTRLSQLPNRQQQLQRKAQELLEKQQQLIAKNQELAEKVFRKAKGQASDHEVQFTCQIRRMQQKFIPWCEGQVVNLQRGIEEAPAPEEEPALYRSHVVDVERVTRGTMELIVACKALALELSTKVDP